MQKENEIDEKINDIKNSTRFCGKKLIKEALFKNIDKPTNKFPLLINEIKINGESYLLSFLEDLEVLLSFSYLIFLVSSIQTAKFSKEF